MSKEEKNDNKENTINPFAKELSEDEKLNKETQAENNEDKTDKDNVSNDKQDSNEELENLKNQYVRLAADFDNFRKRQAQEREALLKYGAENTLKLLLPVLDTYIRGKKACDEMEDTSQLRENYEVIFKQLFEALDKAGLKKIETVGKEFDPNLHEAVMQTPTSDHPDNTIIDELQSGYMLEDRVLRAAMVNVATNV